MLLIVVLLMAALVSCGYVLYDTHALKRQISQTQLFQEARLQEQLQQAQQLQIQLNRVLKVQEEKKPVLEKTASIQLQEVHTLIRMAQLKLLSSDVKGALVLLNKADKNLFALKYDRALKIRRRLKLDIAALSSVKMADTEGLWLTIDTLLAKAPLLELKGVKKIETENKPKAARVEQPVKESKDPESTPSKWNRALKATWQEIKSLVKIRKQETPVRHLLSFQEQVVIRDTLQLRLEQIRYALLMKQPKIYQSSIAASHSFLTQHFTAKDNTLVFMQDTLDALKKESVAPILPTLSKTLMQVEAALQEWQG